MCHWTLALHARSCSCHIWSIWAMLVMYVWQALSMILCIVVLDTGCDLDIYAHLLMPAMVLWQHALCLRVIQVVCACFLLMWEQWQSCTLVTDSVLCAYAFSPLLACVSEIWALPYRIVELFDSSFGIVDSPYVRYWGYVYLVRRYVARFFAGLTCVEDSAHSLAKHLSR